MSTTALVLALGILSSSFLGSWHCAGMCGPIASMMSVRRQLWAYHVGRAAAYVALGIVAGWLGQFFLKHDLSAVRWVATGLLALVLIFSGLQMAFPNNKWLQNKHHWGRFFLAPLHRLRAFSASRSGFIVGLLTAFLPCGWLYTYVTAAVATQSPWAGGFTLFLFWLGGLPALSAAPWLIRQAVAKAGLKQQRVAGLVLIVAGLYSLASFLWLHSP